MNIKNILVVIFLMIVVIVPIFLLPRIVKVNDIICISQYGDCPNELTGLLESVESKSYLESKKLLMSEISKADYVKEHDEVFRLPGTILVRVLLRKSVFAFKNPGLGEYYLVDPSGYVLVKSNTASDLPFIEIGNILNSGERLSNSFIYDMNLVRKTAVVMGIEKSYLGNDGLYLKLKEGPLVIFPKDGDDDLLIGTLIVANDQLNKELQNHRIEKDINLITLDLRFKNPVIKM